jgi:hypothetical protein
MPNQQSPSSSARNGPSLFARTSTLFAGSRTRKDKNPLTITSPIQEWEPPDDPDGGSSIRSSSPSPDSSTTSPALARSLSKSSRHRYSQSVATIDLQSLRRSVSLRSVASPQRPHYRPANLAHSFSTSVDPRPASSHSSKPLLHIPTFAKRQKSTDNVREFAETPVDKFPGGMAAVQYRNTQPGRPPGTSHSMSNLNYSQTNGSLASSAPAVPAVAPGAQNPQTIYQHISDTCSKRISTLDYLRKAYVAWLYDSNSVHTDIYLATKAACTGSTHSSSQNPTS